VVARAEEDVSWLSIYLSDIPHTVYQVAHVLLLCTTLQL
jgi:hypothetical protein